MPVYRVDFANGEFYIGKCVDMRKRMISHRCPTGGGLKTWYPEKDVENAKHTIIEYETETETLLEIENRHIRLHLGDMLCLNRARPIRTEEERKEYEAQKQMRWQKENPDKLVDYNKRYNEKYAEEHGESRWKQYYNDEEKKAEVLRKQKERYANMTPEQKAHKLALGKIAKAKKKEAGKSLGE
jgi:hypothetical protein